MNIPLNVDWQQILLHWMNLAILAGGLYFLLYAPVKKFMAGREARYQEREDGIRQKLAEAEQLKAEYETKLAGAGDEIHAAQAKAQQATQQAAEEQLSKARQQAEQILNQARAEAEYTKERARKESQRELKAMAAQAARKLAASAQDDPFDQFLNAAQAQSQGGTDHEK